MSSFARVQDGAVVELFDVLPVFTPDLMATIFACGADVAEGWLWDGHTFSAPPPEVEPGPPDAITPLQFLARFTDDEQLAIATAAQQSPALQLWLAKATAAEVIELENPLTVAGLEALVQAGLLTEDRKTAILTP